MAREKLEAAGDLLASAADQISDPEHSDRLADLAEQLSSLSTADHGPDHGRLARFQATLDEVQPAVDDDTAATIADARDKLSEYRKTIDGV